jgi:hypothetical protein
VTAVEGVNIDIGLVKGQQPKPVFPLEGQGGDFPAQMVGPAKEDFRNRTTIHADAGTVDEFHDPRAVHII